MLTLIAALYIVLPALYALACYALAYSCPVEAVETRPSVPPRVCAMLAREAAYKAQYAANAWRATRNEQCLTTMAHYMRIAMMWHAESMPAHMRV